MFIGILSTRSLAAYKLKSNKKKFFLDFFLQRLFEKNEPKMLF